MDVVFSPGGLSAFLIIISSVPYAWGIYTRRIKRPVISTWGIWTIVSGIFLYSSYDAGARIETTLLAPSVGFISSLTNFILTLKYGERSWSKTETYCVIVCFITVSFIIALKMLSIEAALLGLIGACIADAMGLIPQIRKIRKDPSDEPWFPWVAFCIGSAINFKAVEIWEIKYYLYPAFMTAGSAIVTIPLVIYYIRQKMQPV